MPKPGAGVRNGGTLQSYNPELRWLSTEPPGTVNMQEPGFTSSKWYNLRARPICEQRRRKDI